METSVRISNVTAVAETQGCKGLQEITQDNLTYRGQELYMPHKILPPAEVIQCCLKILHHLHITGACSSTSAMLCKQLSLFSNINQLC